MAVVKLKSTPLTNADSSPVTPIYPYQANGEVRCSTGKVEVAATDSATSTYQFVRLPSSARIASIAKYNDALTGGTDYNFGLLLPNGTVVVENVFADAVSLATVDKTGTNILHQALNIDDHGKRLWEIAGAASDPNIQYDVAATAVTPATVAGGLMLEVLWTN